MDFDFRSNRGDAISSNVLLNYLMGVESFRERNPTRFLAADFPKKKTY